MFHTRSILIEDINFIVSRIIKLNSKLENLRREQHEDRRSLQKTKQVLLGAPSVKVMDTKIINVLIGTSST